MHTKKKLKVIYSPKGAAGEYAELALNPYMGCTYRCIYCYNNGRFSKPGMFFSGPRPRLNIIPNIEHDCDILKTELGDKCPEIVMTFLGDCYQPAEYLYKITRQIINILIRFDLPFSILTKSNLILRDVDLLVPYKNFRVGFSFTSINQREVSKWEPGTGNISKRIKALKKFKGYGKPVWVSLEPVMRIGSTINVIHAFKNMVDFYWIGALNHMQSPEPINLVDAKQRIKTVLEYNLVDAKQRIKTVLEYYSCKYQFKQSFLEM